MFGADKAVQCASFIQSGHKVCSSKILLKVLCLNLDIVQNKLMDLLDCYLYGLSPLGIAKKLHHLKIGTPISKHHGFEN